MTQYNEPLREKNSIIETVGFGGKTSLTLYMKNGDEIYIDTSSGFRDFRYGRNCKYTTFLTSLLSHNGAEMLLHGIKVIIVKGSDSIARATIVPAMYIPFEDTEIDADDPANTLVMHAYPLQWTPGMHRIYRDSDPDTNALVAAMLLGLERIILAPIHSYCDSIELAMEQCVNITRYISRVECNSSN